MTTQPRPWAALWTLLIGFFMILVDSTIVSVATPRIMNDLNTNTTGAVWVTSAYLLAYAVPLLLAGRLGDRLGQRRIYLTGLVLFTIASALCGFAPTLGLLIAARVVQGIGASLLTPQTLAVVTRIFPAERRGPAMAVWGTVGGGAAIVGPILGGLLISAFGWPWIFWVNIPVGIGAFALALRFVPTLPTSARNIDLLGVLLSGGGLFAIVFGVQQSGSAQLLAIPGVILIAAFVFWQARTRGEPLLPLRLFRQRDFWLASLALAAMAFAIGGLAIPLMLFEQGVLHDSALQSSLILLPMALVMIALAPVVGRLITLVDPRYLAAFGFACMIGALIWIAAVMHPGIDNWRLVAPSALVGLGSAFLGAPISTVGVRRLPLELAGAGSGAFNAFRQVGAVLGSAAFAAILQALLRAHFPRGIGAAGASALAGGYSTALGQSLLLPAAVLIVGVVTSLLFTRSRPASLSVTDDRTASSTSLPGR